MHDTDADIAQEVDDGSYYSAARRWYSDLFHTPIAERSYYIIVIFLAFLNGYFAIESFMGVFPISPRVPFIVYSDNIWDDLPEIRRIAENKSENKNVAVMKFLLGNYVVSRESYDLQKYELRYRNVWSQSGNKVFEQYKTLMDASNPYGPYRLYTNKAKRAINIVSVSYERGEQSFIAHVVFTASVISLVNNQELAHSKWQADMVYNYTNFSVDQSLDQGVWVARFFGLTGNSLKASGERRKVVPMTFMVSNYQVKELLE